MSDYARAVNRLEERIINAIVHAEDEGLTTAEIVAELRRLADQIEEEG
jgi:hypothetical protein